MSSLNEAPVNGLNQYVRIRDIVAACRISRSSVIRAIYDGDLPAYRPHDKTTWRIRATDANAWIETVSSRDTVAA